VACAEDPRTSLREVLADFRPKLSAIRAFADAFGEGALDDLPPHPVTVSCGINTSLRRRGLISTA
jgi:hypothetical protein